jgi:hypothetical protein
MVFRLWNFFVVRRSIDTCQEQTNQLVCFFASGSMIRKGGNRFSEKIMLKQTDEIMRRLLAIAS